MIRVPYRNNRQDCRSWLTVHTIPLAPVYFQLEHLWLDKVVETSRRQWRLQLVLGLILPPAAPFHAFTKSVWHVPSLNVSQKQPGIRTAIDINVRNYPRYLSKKGYVEYATFGLYYWPALLTCCKMSKQSCSQWPCFSRGSRKRKITSTIGWVTRVCWETF